MVGCLVRSHMYELLVRHTLTPYIYFHRSADFFNHLGSEYMPSGMLNL
jgi:hypothetical protein